MHDLDKPRAPALRLSAILTQLCDAEAEAASAPEQAEHRKQEVDDRGSVDSSAAPGKNPARRRFLRSRRVPSQLTVGEIIDRTSHAGFGFMLGFLAIVSIPFFGISTPFGLAIAFGASQMIVGRERPWLPRSIRRRRISLATLNWLSTRLARRTAGLERIIRPRFSFMVQGPFWSVCGVAILIQGIGLALPLPIPGSNWIFIFPVIAYAVGLLEDDGLLIMCCHTITFVEVLLAIHAWEQIWKALLTVWNWISP